MYKVFLITLKQNVEKKNKKQNYVPCIQMVLHSTEKLKTCKHTFEKMLKQDLMKNKK